MSCFKHAGDGGAQPGAGVDDPSGNLRDNTGTTSSSAAYQLDAQTEGASFLAQ